jgi:hypothetical protein
MWHILWAHVSRNARNCAPHCHRDDRGDTFFQNVGSYKKRTKIFSSFDLLLRSAGLCCISDCKYIDIIPTVQISISFRLYRYRCIIPTAAFYLLSVNSFRKLNMYSLRVQVSVPSSNASLPWYHLKLACPLICLNLKPVTWVESEEYWWWCITLRSTGLSDLLQRPEF